MTYTVKETLGKELKTGDECWDSNFCRWEKVEKKHIIDLTDTYLVKVPAPEAVVLPEKKVLSNVIPEDKYEYARESIYAGFNNALTEIQELNPNIKFATK